jgi:hypothetical protein
MKCQAWTLAVVLAAAGAVAAIAVANSDDIKRYIRMTRM